MPQRLYFALAILFAASVACSQSRADAPAPSDEVAAPILAESTVLKGFGISPRGFPADFSLYGEFLEEVSSFPNSGVMFNGAWRDDVQNGSDAGQIPQPAISLINDAQTFGFTPIIVFGWRSSDVALHLGLPANPTDNWTNQEAQTAFEQMLAAYAGEYHPPFLFLGNESDAYYITDAEDYARWVAFYDRAYAAIKAVSPETQVGPIFQYDRLSGQGWTNGWTEPVWGALDLHDLAKVDLIGLTVYPWLGYATPEEIPDDYLAPLLERISDTPIAITETGWPGENLGVAAPWEQTPEAQVRYIDALRRILAGVDIRILNWLFLHPVDPSALSLAEYLAFGSISLYDQDGERRPVYEPWIAFQP